MHQINHLPPERMTPEQRRHEIASLLANGLARLRISGAEQSAHIAEASEFELGLSGNQLVHSDPINKTTTESK
jgi:hypothetical protein